MTAAGRETGGEGKRVPARPSPGRIRRCDASLGHGWLSGSGLPTVDPAVDQARLPAASTRKGGLFFLYSLDTLAALSQQTNFAVGCYCAEESRCHRSLLRELFLKRGAQVI